MILEKRIGITMWISPLGRELCCGLACPIRVKLKTNKENKGCRKQ